MGHQLRPGWRSPPCISTIAWASKLVSSLHYALKRAPGSGGENGCAASSSARDSLSRSELAISAPLRRHWRISTFPRAKSGTLNSLCLHRQLCGKLPASSTFWGNSQKKQKPAEGGPCIPVEPGKLFSGRTSFPDMTSVVKRKSRFRQRRRFVRTRASRLQAGRGARNCCILRYRVTSVGAVRRPLATVPASHSTGKPRCESARSKGTRIFVA